MRWADQALSDCCHDLTDKADSPVEIGSRGNHALANIGDKTESERTAGAFGTASVRQRAPLDKDLIFRPDRFKSRIDALGIKSLAARSISQSPRRIRAARPAKIKRPSVCASASAKKPSARASIAQASTVQCPPD